MYKSGLPSSFKFLVSPSADSVRTCYNYMHNVSATNILHSVEAFPIGVMSPASPDNRQLQKELSLRVSGALCLDWLMPPVAICRNGLSIAGAISGVQCPC